MLKLVLLPIRFICWAAYQELPRSMRISAMFKRGISKILSVGGGPRVGIVAVGAGAAALALSNSATKQIIRAFTRNILPANCTRA